MITLSFGKFNYTNGLSAFVTKKTTTQTRPQKYSDQTLAKVSLLQMFNLRLDLCNAL